MILSLLLSGLTFLAAPAPSPSGQSLMHEGQALYRQGDLGGALIKFEAAAKAGVQDGEMFYQMGYAYKAVRQDAAASREFMTKAVPLLEKKLLPAGNPRPAPFYYLSSIYINDLADATKGSEIARRGVALADEGRFATLKDGESLFQIGRLYTLSGQQDKAVSWYEKGIAALEKDKSPNKAYLIASVEQLATYYMAKPDYSKAVDWLKRLIELDPSREPQRMSAAILLVKAARYKDALSVLQGFTNDDLATEANYLTRIITRYLELGSPALSAENAKLDDKALQDEIVKSAVKLGEIRKKEDAESPPPAGSVIPATPMPEEGIKRRVVKFKDPNHPTMEEWDAMSGVVTPPPTLPRPPSAARLAADRQMYALLMEYMRRGHPFREWALSQGMASAIFR